MEEQMIDKVWDVEFSSDLLDEYCNMEFGHDDWSMDEDSYGNLIVTFWKVRRNPGLFEGDDDEL
jgi:hypothetical protein